MKHFPVILLLLFLSIQCASPGSPTGGDKDTTPPKLLKSTPTNASVNFKGKEIILFFDEFVKLKDVQKKLIISPPLENMPSISPMGIAAKTVRIKFNEDLKPETTYLINFNGSIEDNNEGNPYGNLQFVFSTGQQIDSLRLKGKVQAVHFTKKPENIVVALYPKSTFKDSTVYRKKPYYVTNVKKDGSFSLTHLKAGDYKAIALAEKNANYLYNRHTDDIGFLKAFINIPKDSLINILLFNEPQKFSFDEVTQKSANHLVITYKGIPKNLKVAIKSPVTNHLIIRENNQVHLWYKTKADTIFVQADEGKLHKKYKRKRETSLDSLMVVLKFPRWATPFDTLKVIGNIPFEKANINKIKVFENDTIPVEFKTKLTKKRQFVLDFDKKMSNKYKILLYPNAITDYLGHQNKDTIKKNIAIPKKETYGTLLVSLEGKITKPVFLELLDKENKIIRKSITARKNEFVFSYLQPATYYIRLVYDVNQNNVWDTGDYLKHLQPEQINRFDLAIQIRANWDIHQKFELK